MSGGGAPPLIVDCGSLGGSSRGPEDLDEAETAAAVKAILATHNVQPNLVVSHADEDHYSYLDRVLGGVQLDQIWLGDHANEYPTGVSGVC